MFNVFEEKKRKYEKNLLKIFNFYNLIIKICILHGHVFVMSCFFTTGPGRIALSHSSFNLDEVLDEFQFYSDGKLLHPRRITRKRIFVYAKTKAQNSCTVIAQLKSAFVFATLIVQSEVSSFQPSCMTIVGLGRKPRKPAFSRHGLQW